MSRVKSPGHRHGLHAALDFDGFKPLLHGSDGDIQNAARRDGAQGVIDVELAGDGDIRGKIQLACDGEAHAEKTRCGNEFFPMRNKIGRFIVAVGNNIAGMIFDDAGIIRVIDIDDAGAAHAEQHTFARHVLCHIFMLCAADVILGEIREEAELKCEACNAVIFKTDGRDLHNAVFAAASTIWRMNFCTS